MLVLGRMEREKTATGHEYGIEKPHVVVWCHKELRDDGKNARKYASCFPSNPYTVMDLPDHFTLSTCRWLIYNYSKTQTEKPFRSWYIDNYGTLAEIIKRYGMPDQTVEVDVKGKTLRYSALCMFAGVAGKPISRLFLAPYAYGYAILESGGFVHGCLNIHNDSISLS